MPTYTIQAATEWGIGGGANGSGKRQKVSGFYVVDTTGRRVRAFTGSRAEIDAAAWAKRCDEMLAQGVLRS